MLVARDGLLVPRSVANVQLGGARPCRTCSRWRRRWRRRCRALGAPKACLRRRYVYGPDWEIKPGKLVSRKGTWVKVTARYSWELAEVHAHRA